MKKIGIVTTWFERGAAYVSKQYKEIWEKNHEVFIYVRGGEDVATDDPNWGCKNLTYGKRYDYTKLDIIDLKHFEKWIKENNLDIVFFNEQHIWAPVILCTKLGVLTGSYIDYYTDKTIKLFEIFDFLICNTQRHYSVFDWHPQVFYVPWGTNMENFNRSQMKTVDSDQLVFFHSAGMNPYRKGTDLLINAFRNLNTKKAKLIIHSQTDIFSFFPKKKKILNDLKDQGKLELVNKTVTSPGLYYKGDVYVYPTRLEGIGLSIAEANSCGMPVITTNEAPMNEFIKDGINGHLINVSYQKKRGDGYFWKESFIDVEHLQNILQEYCDNNELLIDRKEKALFYAEQNFNWVNNSDNLTKIIDDVKILNNKSDTIQKVRTYEKSRGLKFYITNTVLYQRFKKSITNFLK